MSANDRCAEAAAILAHGGTIPDTLRPHLIDLLTDAAETGHMLHAAGIAGEVNATNPGLHDLVTSGALPSALYGADQ